MRAELLPGDVAARLAELRRRCLPERVDDAQHRLDRERPHSTESLACVASRSLAELRALCELARYLHTKGLSR